MALVYRSDLEKSVIVSNFERRGWERCEKSRITLEWGLLPPKDLSFRSV